MRSHDLLTDDTGGGGGGGGGGLFRVYEVSPLGRTLVYLSGPFITSKLVLDFEFNGHTLADSRDYIAEIM